MDYEKAYKAVLETATQWIKDGCTDKEKICLESVFPELRESEDERNERIRKAILGLSYLDGIEPILTKCSVTRSDIRSYLKKQKESLHIEKTCKENADSFTDEDERIRNGLLHHFKNKMKPYWNELAVKDIVAYLEKQKEQKPEEYLDKDKVYAIMKKLHDLSFSQNILVNSTEYKQINEITHDVRDLLDYPIEQKPAEWSNFDKGVLNDAINAVDLLGNVRITKNANEAKAFRVAKDWLETLPERFSLQPKQEWSDEDEEMIKMILGDLEWERRNTTVNKDIRLYDEKISWLKSLRPPKNWKEGWCEDCKVRYNRWKPSEEQMKALQDSIDLDKTVFRRGRLIGLLEDLKKLM